MVGSDEGRKAARKKVRQEVGTIVMHFWVPASLYVGIISDLQMDECYICFVTLPCPRLHGQEDIIQMRFQQFPMRFQQFPVNETVVSMLRVRGSAQRFWQVHQHRFSELVPFRYVSPSGSCDWVRRGKTALQAVCNFNFSPKLCN